MKLAYRVTVAAVVSTAGLVAACSGKTDGSGGGGSSACDDYFQSEFGNVCPGNDMPPASDLAGFQARFDTLCNEAIALPGSGITEASLEACVSAIQAQGCSLSEETDGACSFDTGTLANGATCFSGSQCQSGVCTTGLTPAGGGAAPACGTCVAATPAGQPCSSGPCAPGLACSANSDGTSTCAAVTTSGAGGPCGAAQCATGLYCKGGTCVTNLAAGAACTAGDICAPPLVCPLVSAAGGTSSTCQNAVQAGGACGTSQDCAPNLACSSTSHQCVAVAWVAAGQPCSETALCLVGGCRGNGTSGTCPTVIPDGQPCNPGDATQTCDTFADCIGGTCVLGVPSSCR